MQEQRLQQLQESLDVIDCNRQLFDAGEHLAWIPINTELHKLLIDPNSGPLIEELLPDLTLQPLKKDLCITSLQFIFASPGIEWENGHLKFALFDDAKPPIPLAEWLAQGVAVSQSDVITIKDLVLLMRHNWSAHSARKTLGGKPLAIKSFATITQHGEQLPAFSRLIVDIAEQVATKVRDSANLSLHRATAIVPRSQLDQAVQLHHDAKAVLDTVVEGTSSDPSTDVSVATEKLHVAFASTQLQSIDGFSLRILAHLSESLRFRALIDGDAVSLLKSLAILEAAVLISRVTPRLENRHLALLNLAIGYTNAAQHLDCDVLLELSIEAVRELVSCGLEHVEESTLREALQLGISASEKLHLSEPSEEFAAILAALPSE